MDLEPAYTTLRRAIVSLMGALAMNVSTGTVASGTNVAPSDPEYANTIENISGGRLLEARGHKPEKKNRSSSNDESKAARRDPREHPRQKPHSVENVEVIRNIDYGAGGNPRQTLDLFLPQARDSQSSLPLIIFIHGGAWSVGSKNGGAARVASFVSSGKYAGASINYRLSDEATWPAQTQDSKAAVRWLRGNAARFGIDPGKIAVWGRSAGGHLATMLGVSHGVDGLEGDIGRFRDQDSGVSAVIDYFGPTELLSMNEDKGCIDHDAPDSPESRLIGGPIQTIPDKAVNASPVTYVTNDDAPHLIVHGDGDLLVTFSQSETLDRLLDQAGVESTLIRIKGGGHGRGFPDDRLEPIIWNFLDKHLRGAHAEMRDEVLPAAYRGKQSVPGPTPKGCSLGRPPPDAASG